MIQRETEAFDIRIEPSGPLGGYVTVPPSKNYATRLILAASLARGRSLIRRPAVNDDAQALVRCCRRLGAKIEETGGDLAIVGVEGRPVVSGVLNPGNAGAVLRLLLGVACLVEGEVRFETEFKDSLGRRPNRELLDALRSLGARIEATGEEGTLPITIGGGGARVKAGEVRIDCSRSSQFLSSLLFLTSHLEGESLIRIAGKTDHEPPTLVSRPLIDQTLDVLNRFGARIRGEDEDSVFRVTGGRVFRAGDHAVAGDWPSAAALMGIVATAGGMARLDGLCEDAQGERRSLDAFKAMGCSFSHPMPGQLLIHGKGELGPIQFNGDLATDAVLALEAAACLARGTSRLSGIANLGIKETDRIRVPLEELAKLGVRARHGTDWIEIEGRPAGYDGGVEVECRGDHRIAQMLAIVAVRCARGLTLRGAHCVSKSYPGFFDDLARMGVKLGRLEPASQ